MALTLAWVNPHPPLRKALRPAPRIDLAAAIEAHLEGRDGLPEADFVRLFATGRSPLR